MHDLTKACLAVWRCGPLVRNASGHSEGGMVITPSVLGAEGNAGTDSLFNLFFTPSGDRSRARLRSLDIRACKTAQSRKKPTLFAIPCPSRNRSPQFVVLVPGVKYGICGEPRLKELGRHGRFIPAKPLACLVTQTSLVTSSLLRHTEDHK